MTTFGTDHEPMSSADRVALLALADRDRVVELAAACRADAPPPRFLSGPEVGTVMMQVREPVVGERFHVGEIVVSRAEVAFRDALGWCMRLGDDLDAVAAAAICDAEAGAEGPHAAEVLDLCRSTAARVEREREAEWAELAATEVAFEELD